MPPISSPGTELESGSVSICNDTWKAGSDVSPSGSVEQVGSIDCLSSAVGEGNSGNTGAKDGH